MQEIYRENIPVENEIRKFLSDIKDLSYHEKIIENVIDFSKKIPEVEAVFIMGSLALNTADIFSDIDFYVMIKRDTVLEEIKSIFLSNLKNIGRIIHIFQSNAYASNSIFYFKPYVKFDLVIDYYDKFCVNWRIAERGKLLYDKAGLGINAIKKARGINFDISKYEIEIRNVAIELPSFCYNIAGYMVRGEYITSIDFVAWIRRLLMRISGFLLGIWDEGTRRAETRFPKEILSYYHQCIIHGLKDVWRCLDVLLRWFSEWMVPRFEMNGIEHAGDEIPLIRIMISRLKEKKGNEEIDHRD